MIEVISSGYFTTIQDSGRKSYRHLGVPISGPMDLNSFYLANLLLPGLDSDLVFECTLIGPKLKLRCNSRFVITGAEFDSYLDNEPIENNKVYSFRAGQILNVGRVKAGLRCYLKFEGTFNIPKILNSKSFYYPITKSKSINDGEKYGFISKTLDINSKIINLKISKNSFSKKTLFAKPGPDWDFLTGEIKKQIINEIYFIKSQNRMGYRLTSKLENDFYNLRSKIVIPGIVQFTPGGEMIIATADCQVTGGYLQILFLTLDSLSNLAQKPEGSEVKFMLLEK
jgi:biotin-dependent carboxylase-like uncharacterized protein